MANIHSSDLPKLHSMSFDTDWKSTELSLEMNKEDGYYCNLKFLPVVEMGIKNMTYHVYAEIVVRTNMMHPTDNFYNRDTPFKYGFADVITANRAMRVLSVPLKPGVIQKTSVTIALSEAFPSSEIESITIVMEADENKSKFKLVFDMKEN